ncbi:MAG: response regulator [Candidatus Nitrosocosmicus sp.]|nr:response regulator [Candidatus Nitrosocosmicus sp.]
MYTPVSIMIVDDEWDVARVIELSIARRGLDTILFNESLLALEHYRQNPKRYSLIVVDWSMPNLNGLDLAKEIRKYDSKVKILLITGWLIEDVLDSIGYKDAKISAVLRKPIDLDDLAQRIDQLCS